MCIVYCLSPPKAKAKALKEPGFLSVLVAKASPVLGTVPGTHGALELAKVSE